MKTKIDEKLDSLLKKCTDCEITMREFESQTKIFSIYIYSVRKQYYENKS